MKAIRRFRSVSEVIVENYCCPAMKYHIDIKHITFDEIGFFLFGCHGFEYCPFCGEKINYK